MSSGEGNSGKTRGRRPKPPARWRRHLVQAELELPPPYASSGSGSVPDVRSRVDESSQVFAPEPAWWQRLPVVAGLAVVSLLLLATTIVTLQGARRDRESAAAADERVKTLTLRASTTERALRIEPNRQSFSAAPDAVIRWPEPPEQLDLYLPVAYAEYPAFALTVDKVDQGRALIVHRMVPDSNHELRLSLNSSAFGPGEYRIRLQGYTWRGDRVDAGWVRLVVK